MEVNKKGRVRFNIEFNPLNIVDNTIIEKFKELENTKTQTKADFVRQALFSYIMQGQTIAINPIAFQPLQNTETIQATQPIQEEEPEEVLSLDEIGDDFLL